MFEVPKDRRKRKGKEKERKGRRIEDWREWNRELKEILEENGGRRGRLIVEIKGGSRGKYRRGKETVKRR